MTIIVCLLKLSVVDVQAPNTENDLIQVVGGVVHVFNGQTNSSCAGRAHLERHPGPVAQRHVETYVI